MTKRELIVWALRDGGTRGVCLTDLARLDPTVPYRARNYIAELRKAGMDIKGERCRAHRHQACVFRYSLSGVTTQLELEA